MMPALKEMKKILGCNIQMEAESAKCIWGALTEDKQKQKQNLYWL